MFHTLIRGDIAPITIGARTNVQDGTIIHTKHSVPLDIAEEVGIGHKAVVHCRRIGRRTLIGIGSVILDDCEIGENCIIGAGAVCTPGTIIPDGSVVLGTPAKVVRRVGEKDLAYIHHVVTSYIELGRRHARGEFPPAPTCDMRGSM